MMKRISQRDIARQLGVNVSTVSRALRGLEGVSPELKKQIKQLTWNQIYECVGNALHMTPKLYHVASDFLAAVAPKEWDFEGNLLGDKSLTVQFDCSKLKCAVPGFCATTRFDEGVRRCVAYLLAHPELQIEEPDFDAWCDRVIDAQEAAKSGFCS